MMVGACFAGEAGLLVGVDFVVSDGGDFDSGGGVGLGAGLVSGDGEGVGVRLGVGVSVGFVVGVGLAGLRAGSEGFISRVGAGAGSTLRAGSCLGAGWITSTLSASILYIRRASL